MMDEDEVDATLKWHAEVGFDGALHIDFEAVYDHGSVSGQFVIPVETITKLMRGCVSRKNRAQDIETMLNEIAEKVRLI